jgi:soluble lytic murein transglycosylase-like protein
MPDVKPEAPASAPAAPEGKSRALLIAAAGAALLALLLRSSKAVAAPLTSAPPGVPADKWALYGALINQVADEVGIPASVLAALVSKESVGWNNDGPRMSQCPAPCVSRFEPRINDCSYGLTQVLTQTAARYGISAEQLCDPYWGLKAGALYIKDLYERPDIGGDWSLAFSAYNAGPGRAEQHVNSPYVQQAVAYQQKYQKAGLSGAKLFRVRG